MQIFKVKAFDRWSKDEGLTDKALSDAIKEMEDGLIDADLGSNVYNSRSTGSLFSEIPKIKNGLLDRGKEKVVEQEL